MDFASFCAADHLDFNGGDVRWKLLLGRCDNARGVERSDAEDVSTLVL